MLTVPLIAWLVAKGRKRERKKGLPATKLPLFSTMPTFGKLYSFQRKLGRFFFLFFRSKNWLFMEGGAWGRMTDALSCLHSCIESLMYPMTLFSRPISGDLGGDTSEVS